jgi:hypothetical protein
VRTRLLAALAVLAAALLAPSAVLAAPPAPVLSQPTTPTAAASIPLAWLDVAGEDGYHVYRAEADCSGEVDISTVTTVGADQTTFSDLSPAEGTHCYFVRAYDIGGESPDSNHVLVTSDTQPPSGSITAPAFGSTLSTHSHLVPIMLRSADAADGDGSGVASVEYFAQPLLGSFASVGAPATSAPYDFAWLPADGTYDLKAVITDNLGHTFETPVVSGVVVDGTPPAVTLSGVTDNAKVRGSLPLTAIAADGETSVQSVAFEYRQGSSGPFTTIGSPDASPPYGPVSFDTVALGLANGTYEVHALATDAAGNTFADTATNVLVDNTVPTVTLSGVASNAKVHGSLSLSATAGDVGGSNVQSVAFEYRPGSSGPFTAIGSPDTTAPYGPVSFDTVALGLANGTYEVHALATDGAGNTAVDTAANVLVDNTAPTVTLSGVASTAKVHGSLSLSATAGDVGGSGLQSVAFEYRPGSSGPFMAIGSPDTTAPYGPVSFDTVALGLADGTYEIHALATDGAGNTAVNTATNVLVDNTQPTVTIGGVANNDKVRGTLQLSATAADTGGSGVATVQFGRRPAGSGGAYANIGSALALEPYDASFDTTGVPDGLYEIGALATDVAGNARQSAPVSNVLVDNHAPLTPATPTGLSPVSAAPTITFSGTTDPAFNGVQSGVDHYDVYRGGVKVNVAAILHTGAALYSWSDVAGQSTAPASGTQSYSYTVKAVDVAGNVSVASPPQVIVLDPTAVSAPTGVAPLATPTSQRPQLTWLAPAAPPFTVEHYDVYRDGVLVLHTAGAVTTFTDGTPSLADGTYTYQVIAAASDGTTVGVASGAVTIVYDTTPPAAPGGVTATAAVDGSVGIGWAAASDGTGSGISRYVVRRALSSTPPASATDGDAICQSVTTSCIDAAALNGKFYSYAVFAVDRAGNTSPAGNSPAVTARDQLPPAVPQGLSATPGDGTVALRWAAAGPDDDVAGYVLVAKQGGQAPTSDTDGTRVCTAIVAGSTSCVADGLTNGATYTFALFALDEALNRSQPAVVSSAPNGKVSDVKGPAAVSRLKATVSGHKVRLTWKNPVDRDFDHVEVTAGERKPAALNASKRVYSGKGTTATITVAPGQSRWFVVVAYDLVGNASAPASVHVAIAASSKFGPPPRAKVHGKVKLTWPLAKGAKYYNVQVYAGKKRIFVSWPSGRALQLPRAKLKRGTKYTWYVWPGLGAKAKAHYGKLIGRNAFTFTG